MITPLVLIPAGFITFLMLLSHVPFLQTRAIKFLNINRNSNDGYSTDRGLNIGFFRDFSYVPYIIIGYQSICLVRSIFVPEEGFTCPKALSKYSSLFDFRQLKILNCPCHIPNMSNTTQIRLLCILIWSLNLAYAFFLKYRCIKFGKTEETVIKRKLIKLKRN